MKTSRDKFKEYLEEGEVILDHVYPKVILPSYNKIIPIFLTGIFLAYFLEESSLGFIVGIGFLTAVISGFILLFKIIANIFPNGNAITSRKIIILSGTDKPSFSYFEDIFDIEVEELENKYGTIQKFIRFYLDPKKLFLPRKSKSIRTSKNADFIYPKIVNHWKSRSPYKLLHQEINKFLTKYKIKNFPLKHKSAEDIHVKGKISGMEISITISNYESPQKLQAEIRCPNEESNYFYLSQEKGTDILKKMTGMQDYLIGNEWIDEQFILQSNHEPFIKNILDDNILDRIKKIDVQHRYSLSFGEKQKMEKKEFKLKENQALDEHLLGTTDHKMRTKDNTSILTLEYNDFPYQLNYTLVGKDIVEKLELMIQLAKKINQYNNHTQT